MGLAPAMSRLTQEGLGALNHSSLSPIIGWRDQGLCHTWYPPCLFLSFITFTMQFIELETTLTVYCFICGPFENKQWLLYPFARGGFQHTLAFAT